jgi:rare lipoprotein A (peptidoglycan hydrolase)
LLGGLVALVLPLSALAQESPLTRRDGFLQLWQSVLRPAYETTERSFADVPEGAPGFLEITYAKRRGLLDNDETFRPDEPLLLGDALLWLYRTRNIADPDQMEREHLAGLLERYPLVATNADMTQAVNADELQRLITQLTEARRTEETIVSQYGEEFRGEGTAFGETFNPDDFTAAHVTFPVDTLTRVTHVEDGRSVLVRVNDRGPFVPGRTMDLSSAAFGALAEGSRGILTATIERLGDINLVDPALRAAWEAQRTSLVDLGEVEDTVQPEATDTEETEEVAACDLFGARFQQRVTRDVRLIRGVPHSFKLGGSLTLRSTAYFVIRSVVFPDGSLDRRQQWIDPDERYELTPSQTGEYVFRIGTPSGAEREMRMRVVRCS